MGWWRHLCGMLNAYVQHNMLNGDVDGENLWQKTAANQTITTLNTTNNGYKLFFSSFSSPSSSFARNFQVRLIRFGLGAFPCC